MTGSRRRWPPNDKLEPRSGDWPPPAGFEPMAQAIGDLAQVLRHMTPVVLAEATYVLDGNGQATEQHRFDFAALAVTSLSPNPLRIATGSKKAAAPGPGPGSAVIPPAGHKTVNMAGNSWTIYGGNPGDLVTVEALSRPVPPMAMTGQDYPAPNLAAAGAFLATAAGSALLPAGVPATGFDITSAANGATAVSGIVTVTGLAAGTLSWEYIFPNAGNGEAQLSIRFPGPLAAASPATAVTLNMPAVALGTAGNLVLYGQPL